MHVFEVDLIYVALIFYYLSLNCPKCNSLILVWIILYNTLYDGDGEGFVSILVLPQLRQSLPLPTTQSSGKMINKLETYLREIFTAVIAKEIATFS